MVFSVWGLPSFVRNVIILLYHLKNLMVLEIKRSGELDGVSQLKIWRGQLRVGSSPTAGIPTLPLTIRLCLMLGGIFMRTKRTLNVSKTADLADIRKEFSRYNKSKGLRNTTISSYEYYLDDFENWLSVPLSFVSVETIEEYMEELSGRGIKDTTIQTHIRHIRAFLYFCMERDYLDRFKIRLPKADEPYKEPYTEEEVERLIAKPKSANFVEWRSWIFVCLLLATGCRLSTAISLRVKDIDFEKGYIYYPHTKNRKNQFVPLSKKLSQNLRIWLEMARLGDEDYIFPNSYAEEPAPLNKSTIQHEIARYNADRGVSRHSIHLFRHTFAKNWIINGGSVAKLQRILGHSSLSTTNRYLLLYSADLKDGFDNFTII